eukprot:ANDGO_03242.mRNA.1 hypothetical protein H257_11705
MMMTTTMKSFCKPVSNSVVVPGSFNPFHQGHAELAFAALQKYAELWSARQHAGKECCCSIVFELSRENVDKPSLSDEEVERRVSSVADFFRASREFHPESKSAVVAQPTESVRQVGVVSKPGCRTTNVRISVAVTKAPRFIDKLSYFQDCAFAVGIDTAVRLVDPKYYGGSRKARDDVLEKFVESGILFLVGGRYEATYCKLPQRHPSAPKFATLSSCPEIEAVDKRFHPLFVEIPESMFRVDVSSSQLRAAQDAQRSQAGSTSSS